MVDGRLPDRAIAGLKDYSQEVAGAVVLALGRYRFNAQAAAAQLQPSERIAQASSTREMIAALRERVSGMDAELDAYIEDIWWNSPWNKDIRAPFLAVWRDQIDPWLLRLSVMLAKAAEQVPQGRTGPKGKENRDRFLKDVAAALRTHAGLGIARSRAVARDIAEWCGIQAPTDERNLKRRMGA
ncbi:hypothetical protein [Arenimonas aestuarii]